MGHLKYGSEQFEFSDIVLGHLQVAIATKLRRRERFFLTWANPAYLGSGRHSLWIDNSVPLQFFYTNAVSSALDMAWIEHVLAAAATPKGLHIPRDEPFATPSVDA